jgi:hypothetical protein
VDEDGDVELEGERPFIELIEKRFSVPNAPVDLEEEDDEDEENDLNPDLPTFKERAALQDELMHRAGFEDCVVVDVDENTFTYYNKTGNLYRLGYSEKDDGSIMFVGAPEPLVQLTANQKRILQGQGVPDPLVPQWDEDGNIIEPDEDE